MKTQKIFVRFALLVMFAFSFISCSPASSTLGTDTKPADTSSTAVLPSSTPTVAPTATQTLQPTNTATPTAVPLSEEERQKILESYRLMILIQFDATYLKETAIHVQNNEISGIESFAALLVGAKLVDEVDKQLTDTIPSEVLKPAWDKMLPVHEQTKKIYAAWYNNETDSAKVAPDAEKLIADAEAILKDVDKALAGNYGFKAEELSKTRVEMKAQAAKIFDTPTPAPAGSGDNGTGPVSIASSFSYTSDGGYYKIVGEIKNTTNQPVQFVKVVATMRNDKGDLTGTESSYTDLDVIPAGGISPFEISTNKAAGTTKYDLQVQYDPGTLPEQVLKIPSHHSYTSSGGFYKIVGEVQNIGQQPMEFVKVVATLYDDAGKVTGAINGYVNLDKIPAGGTAPFEISSDRYEGSTKYIVQVQGSPASDLGGTDLEITDSRTDQDSSYLHVQGQIKNNGATDAEFVQAVITLYDKNGKVAGVANCFTDLEKVPAGGVSPFDCTTDHFEGFDHISVQVQGQ